TVAGWWPSSQPGLRRERERRRGLAGSGGESAERGRRCSSSRALTSLPPPPQRPLAPPDCRLRSRAQHVLLLPPPPPLERSRGPGAPLCPLRFPPPSPLPLSQLEAAAESLVAFLRRRRNYLLAPENSALVSAVASASFDLFFPPGLKVALFVLSQQNKASWRRKRKRVARFCGFCPEELTLLCVQGLNECLSQENHLYSKGNFNSLGDFLLLDLGTSKLETGEKMIKGEEPIRVRVMSKCLQCR
ncbi:hypothetical protein JD844_031998, partial [Phrynosoma platyrhinos]